MRVVVIGAGFAGLAAAESLAEGGDDVVVLEARQRVGGRVWSRELPSGEVVEMGAEFVLPDDTVVRSFVDRLGLRLFEKGTTYGDREPRGGIGVTRTQLVAGYAAVQAAAAAGRLVGPTVVDALAGLAMTDGAREAILARIEVSTAYRADDQAAAVLAESGTGTGTFATHSVAGGNQRIALELASRLGERVHLGAAVESIGWTGIGVTVRTRDAELAADRAVVAVPASVLGRIRFDPPLPRRTSAAFAAVRYGHAAKLFVPLATAPPPSATLAVPDRFWSFTQHDPDGAPLRVVGSFAGSPLALERLGAAAGPDRWIAALATLRPDLDLRPDDAVLSTWSDDPWVEGAYSARSVSSPIDDATLAASVGPLHFAGEHTAGEWHALMEGALRSGLRAASEIRSAARLDVSA